MLVEVMSREMLTRYAKEPHNEKSLVVSIGDVENDANLLKSNPLNNIKYRRCYKFDDVEKGEPNCITKHDAEQIALFVKLGYDKVDKIIVQCDAGVSRSAGVAAAIMYYLNDGDDSPIFDNPMYCPNMACYRTMLNEFFNSTNDDLIIEKEQRNIEVWKKANDIE